MSGKFTAEQMKTVFMLMIGQNIQGASIKSIPLEN